MDAYRAYVISETESTFTFISERDKKLHMGSKKTDGSIPEAYRLDEEHVVSVQRPFFTDPSRLFTACREYCYDKVKNAKAGARKRQARRELRQKALKEKEEQQAKGMMKWGKYKNATYENIMLVDEPYCDWILKQTNKNEDIIKFKAYLQEHYKKDE